MNYLLKNLNLKKEKHRSSDFTGKSKYEDVVFKDTEPKRLRAEEESASLRTKPATHTRQPNLETKTRR